MFLVLMPAFIISVFNCWYHFTCYCLSSLSQCMLPGCQELLLINQLPEVFLISQVVYLLVKIRSHLKVGTCHNIYPASISKKNKNKKKQWIHCSSEGYWTGTVYLLVGYFDCSGYMLSETQCNCVLWPCSLHSPTILTARSLSLSLFLGLIYLVCNISPGPSVSSTSI